MAKENYPRCEKCGTKTKFSHLCWNCTYPEDALMKYPKIKRYDSSECVGLFDDQVIITVKEDGSNIGWRKDSKLGTLNFRAREWILQDRPEMEDDKKYKRIYDFLMLKLDGFDPRYTFYGEAVGRGKFKHKVDYLIDFNVIIFDIYDNVTKEFLTYGHVRRYAHSMGMSCVDRYPEDFTVDDALDDIKNMHKEGVVIKNYTKQIFGKAVLDEYREKVRLKNTPKKEGNWEEVFIEETVTVPRVEKIMMNAHDEGIPYGNKMIPYLLKNLWKDIIEEELVNFVMEQGGKLTTMNFKLIKNKMVEKGRILLNDVLKRRLNAETETS